MSSIKEIFNIRKIRIKESIAVLSTLYLPDYICFFLWYLQIEMYNHMVEKEGTEDEEEAMKAYRAARNDSDQAVEMAVANKASSALIDRVSSLQKGLELLQSPIIPDVNPTNFSYLSDSWFVMNSMRMVNKCVALSFHILG